MMKENIIKTKSYRFAVSIVKLYQYLVETKREFVLSKQLLRSGTSIGAMVREAEHAETKNDFKHKMAIAQKEINETIYWLELLLETNYLTKEQFDKINKEAIVVIKLITTIIKTTKANMLNC